MEFIALFLTSALTAFAVENVVFGRALGINKQMLFLKSPSMGILYGGLLTALLTLSSFLVSGVNVILEGNPYIPYIRAPIYFLCVAIVYCLVWFGTRAYLPRLHIRLRTAMPITTFNTALFGALYVSAIQDFGFAQTTGYALGAGLGYTAALLIIYYARKRLAISPIPRVFRGLPIMLVYIGLLSLAIYGLIGHGLLA